MRITKDRVYFWASVLGNWSRVKGGIEIPAEYFVSGHSFKVPTSEHVFMFLKARFFGDFDVANRILSTPDPKEAKKWGRLVKGFDEKKYDPGNMMRQAQKNMPKMPNIQMPKF